MNQFDANGNIITIIKCLYYAHTEVADNIYMYIHDNKVQSEYVFA